MIFKNKINKITRKNAKTQHLSMGGAKFRFTPFPVRCPWLRQKLHLQLHSLTLGCAAIDWSITQPSFLDPRIQMTAEVSFILTSYSSNSIFFK